MRHAKGLCGDCESWAVGQFQKLGKLYLPQNLVGLRKDMAPFTDSGTGRPVKMKRAPLYMAIRSNARL
jgi:hypothetical protein